MILNEALGLVHSNIIIIKVMEIEGAENDPHLHTWRWLVLRILKNLQNSLCRVPKKAIWLLVTIMEIAPVIPATASTIFTKVGALKAR